MPETELDIDVISSAPEPRRSRPAATVALVAAFAVGGYLVGAHHATPPAAPRPAPTGPTTPGDAALTAAGPRCSRQLGTRLQLGIEIANPSATPTTLRAVRPGVPLGGLTPRTSTWGTCGELTPRPATMAITLASGATTWLATIFDVLAPCPGPLPVSFTVDYDHGAGLQSADLPAFVDLGDVPYTAASCPPG